MAQPDWEIIANLGDAHPADYGGFFVLRDKTGVYEAEAEVIDVPSEEPDEESPTMVYRFPLDRCTDIAGVLSDNRYHPEHAAWFAEHLASIGACADIALPELRAWFCSEDPIQRAWAYRAVGDYFGFHELDHDPLRLTVQADVEARCKRWLRR